MRTSSARTPDHQPDPRPRRRTPAPDALRTRPERTPGSGDAGDDRERDRLCVAKLLRRVVEDEYPAALLWRDLGQHRSGGIDAGQGDSRRLRAGQGGGLGRSDRRNLLSGMLPGALSARVRGYGSGRSQLVQAAGPLDP